MSYERMQRAELELKAQIDALLERAKSTDAAEADEPELDIPAEIERREVRLKAITQARARLEQRQREADIERGRSEDDERKPRDEHGKPKGGRYKREFGVPEAKAQDNFTDPDSRIMKRAGGGFDASYNAQTAVDDTAHIIVAAELSNHAADTQQLVPMLQAVKHNTGEFPRQGLADAGYRSEGNFEQLAQLPIERWWRSGVKANSRRKSIPRPIHARLRWPPNCKPTRAERLTADASGSPSRPTAGSRTCSGSANSVCEDCTACKPSSNSSVWR
jgi:hypothetical protein